MNQPEQQQQPPGTQGAMTPEPGLRREELRGPRPARRARPPSSPAATAASDAPSRSPTRARAPTSDRLPRRGRRRRGHRAAGRGGRPPAVLVPGDSPSPQHCRDVIAARGRGVRPDRHPGQQRGLPDDATTRSTRSPTRSGTTPSTTNIGAMFHLVKAAVPHMAPGSSIIGSSSVNSDMPSPTLAPYAATKAAIANFSRQPGPAARREGHPGQQRRAGADLDAADPGDHAAGEGRAVRGDTPLGRAGQPAELAPVYVLLASDEGSYISGARIAVTGGRPVL